MTDHIQNVREALEGIKETSVAGDGPLIAIYGNAVAALMHLDAIEQPPTESVKPVMNKIRAIDDLMGDGMIIIGRGDDGKFRDANDNVWLPEEGTHQPDEATTAKAAAGIPAVGIPTWEQDQGFIRQVARERIKPGCPFCKNDPELCGSCISDAEEAVKTMAPYLCSSVREMGGLDKDVQIDAWRSLANAKQRVKWRRGFPTEAGMYLVRLTDGEMCVTPWNDGEGKNTDTWGDKRKTGWCCLTDSQSTVKGWISVKDLRTLPADSIINRIEVEKRSSSVFT